MQCIAALLGFLDNLERKEDDSPAKADSATRVAQMEARKRLGEARVKHEEARAMR